MWWRDLSDKELIDEMQCCFMSGPGTTYAIFIVRQLQTHLAANKPLYMIVFHEMSSGGQCAN